jgi:hypothetical protein
VPIATTITATVAPPAAPERAAPEQPGRAAAAPPVAVAPVAAAPPMGVTARAVVTGVVVVLLGWAASIWANGAADPQALKLPAGVSLFALFYVVTQGLERLLEPFARLWDTTRAPAGERDAATVEAERHMAAGNLAAANERLAVAAAMQAAVEQRRANRTVVLWAVASVLGMLLSAVLGLYLLHAVGLQDDLVGIDGRVAGGWGGPAGLRHALDLLVTGLAIGGGTKPLHDLIQNIQEAKNDKKDPAHVRP